MAAQVKNTHGFAKGNPGKPKGAVTKIGADVKAMILEALQKAGGAKYLEARAKDPKTAAAFLSLVGKVLPMQVTGADGGPLQIARIELVPLVPLLPVERKP